MSETSYKINEIFGSLQGEGFHAGTAATFVRFSGCNLQCPFCDTQHQDGRRLTLGEVLHEVRALPAQLVVLTGGEPSLFADEALVAALHEAGKYVTIETNGTHEPPSGIDWVTLSPKDAFVPDAEPCLTRCDELKLIYAGTPPRDYAHIQASHRFLQPCDTPDAALRARWVSEAAAWCAAHPSWRLSLQLHKIVGLK